MMMILPTGNDLGCSKNIISFRKKPVFNTKASFTLLELFLVLVIIGIALGMSFPVIKRNVRKVRFQTAVDKIYFFLDYAKSQAVLKGNVTEVNFDSEERKFLFPEGGTGKSRLKEIQVPGQFRVEAGEEEMFFYPDGTMQEFEIVVSGQGSKQIRIWSQGFDGKIRVESSKGE